jgi:radical SAM superfamily enzyme YgiQ (UPF0313 family)
MPRRILLSGVFGPFGVDDEFGRKENIMELFHNQVTKAQGLASLRFHHRSFGLYFLAENVQAPVTVLDFPSRSEFIRTLKRERFDVVGISFIVPNFVKAREMARLVRKHQPRAKIILGGHGAAIEGIEQRIDCDHVVKGEGIRGLRRFLGEDESAPVRHPTLVSAEDKRLFGIPTPGVGALLVPGVGCVNGCNFCATSHFFSKEYTPFFGKGEDLYRNAVRIGEELGTDEFFVMDENFLKSADRARELLACMERDGRPLQFAVFSSAEAITAFGVENMVRLGVNFVWIGAESRRDVYEKNRGLDLKALIRGLRDHGIAVLVSGILFLDHHTKENIRDDIDFIVDLGGDLTQFMQYTPMPGTRLYQKLKEEKRIDFELPFEEWHGQHLLNWRHPHFTRDEARRVLGEAFRLEFDRNSSSVYRMADTALRGYQTLSARTSDRWLWLRREQMRARAEELRLLLPTMRRFAHDVLERERIDALDQRFQAVLGREPVYRAAMALGARALAEAHAARVRWGAEFQQPKTHLTRFRWPLDPVEQRAADVVDALRQRVFAALGARGGEPA